VSDRPVRVCITESSSARISGPGVRVWATATRRGVFVAAARSERAAAAAVRSAVRMGGGRTPRGGFRLVELPAMYLGADGRTLEAEVYGRMRERARR